MYDGRLLQNYAMINEIHKSIAVPPDKDRPVLYHYTSVKVADSILEKAIFWASNIHYLNDAEEYYRGISYLLNLFDSPEYDQIRQIIGSIRLENGASSEGVFSISFSSQEDNLHQWITYSKEAGICIGLDFDLLKQYYLTYEAFSADELSKEIYGSCANIITKALYIKEDSNKDKQTIRENILNAIVKFYDYLQNMTQTHSGGKLPVQASNILDAILNSTMSQEQVDAAKRYFRLYASYCKNDAFNIEDEIRAAILPLFFKHAACAKINYFTMESGVIRPYIKIGFLLKDSDKEISPLPIKSIMVGPARNQQAVFDSVVHRIKYGKSMVWDYWKKRDEKNAADPFWENFISYVCGAVERFAHKNARSITRNELKSVSEKLWSIWCEENRVAFDKKPTDLEKRIIEKFKRTQPTLVRDSRSDRHMEILASISRDNYFTKEGIWIKKSQIAYVF